MGRDRGPICCVDCRAPIDDPRLTAREDVDREVSQIDTTRRTPGAPETTCGMASACRHW